ncbi:MAG: MBL fold metallo-hydrolase [Planctomycetota bacterium]
MALELTFLGTGTSMGVPMIGCNCPVCTSDDPRDRRMRSSAVVRYPRTEPVNALPPGLDPPPDRYTVLIDTTPDLRPQAIRARLNWLDAVVYTHGHADHILGLDDLRRFNTVMDRAIDIFAEPNVIEQFRQTFGYIFAHDRHKSEQYIAHLIAHPLHPGETRGFGDAHWTPLRLMHGRLPILGYRVDWQGRSLAYCTDVSTIPPQTFDDLNGLDLLVIDGLRFRHHPTHLTIDRACELAAQIGATQTLLTHIAHDVGHAQTDPQLPDAINLAHDGLRVVLEAGSSAVNLIDADHLVTSFI